MIPRLHIPRLAPSGSARWPEAERGYPPLFRGRLPFRKLVVLIDDHLLVDPEDGRSKQTQLAGLLTHPLVELYRHADAGPPASTFRAGGGPRVAPGWVVVGADDGDNPSVVYEREGRTVYTGIGGNGISFAAVDTSTLHYQDGGWEHAIARRRQDARAVGTAEAIDADLFVTDRPYAVEVLGPASNGVACLTPEAALTLVGLYLRAQGAYAVYGPTTMGTELVSWNRGLLYWVGARQALPAAWRWFSACVDHSHGGGDEQLIYLGSSLLQRVERTLRARDAVHVALNQPQNNDTADEALAAFDEAVLLLMGAVDAAARVAHAVLSLPVPTHLVGWQRKQWLKELTKAHPPLAAVVAPGTPADAALKVLRLMRNTVHGEAMSAISASVGGSGTVKNRMSMPGVDQAELRAAVSAAGGEASWGISFERGGIRAEIDVLLERLLYEVVETLNLLMDETPVEKLAYVSLSPDRGKAPDDPNDAVWSATNRLGVAWQLGLKGRAEQP